MLKWHVEREKNKQDFLFSPWLKYVEVKLWIGKFQVSDDCCFIVSGEGESERAEAAEEMKEGKR